MLVVPFFALVRSEITNRRMNADPVVVELNVPVDGIICLLTSFELGLVNELFLNDTVEGLNAGVVVAVALTTHAANHLVRH